MAEYIRSPFKSKVYGSDIVKSNVKAGGWGYGLSAPVLNHNQTVLRATE